MTTPNWRPRLIALDIDGTIARMGENELAPAVRAAIDRAVGHGTHVVLSTGRSLMGTRRVIDSLGLENTTVLCSNGAVWWDTATATVVKCTAFDVGVVVDRLLDLLPGAVYGAEVTGVGNLVYGRFPDGNLWGQLREVDLAEFVAEPTPRLVVRWLDHTPEEMALRLLDVELPGADWTVDHSIAWLTAGPLGVTKGAELEELRIRLGVSAEDTLAIGDGHNDVEMLRWAAHGVAMGQAPATVQEAADAVTGTIFDDGAAQVLDRFFPA
ncbi:HAD-IIB family hydrolase [Umezawaea sp. Da 62-37]|uniref:HAD family hydrolase n=1 Tax=Umezawaea sp. Da 62-37 TaxID=3075927 RepID=UPI0028F73F82|nr:HAD-IIB family hydrolase [Umezawaea sp. Da 62-37]WNV91338.1 HAD-IIB family hydrolase [Umezawaea sp. Da 62-37]